MSVKYSAQSAERSFQLVAADEAPDLISNAWAFEPGTPCQLLSNGDLLISGYVNDLTIHITDTSHELRVSGRSKGQDAHDCSVDHKSYEWRDKDLLEIAKDTGIPVDYSSDEKLQKIDVVRANVGEKVFGFLDRHARSQGLFLSGQADGSVLITKHGKKRHSGGIVEGWNLKEGTAQFSDRDRHEKYKVKGQRPIGTGEKNIRIQETADDNGARKGRILHVMPDQHLTKDRARTRADQIRDTRKGLSVKCQATLEGFRDDGGKVWEAGWLVFVQSTMLHLSQDMAIESVDLSQDEEGSGSLAKLELVDPAALGGKGQGKNRGAPAWSK